MRAGSNIQLVTFSEEQTREYTGLECEKNLKRRYLWVVRLHIQTDQV